MFNESFRCSAIKVCERHLPAELRRRHQVLRPTSSRLLKLCEFTSFPSLDRVPFVSPETAGSTHRGSFLLERKNPPIVQAAPSFVVVVVVLEATRRPLSEFLHLKRRPPRCRVVHLKFNSKPFISCCCYSRQRRRFPPLALCAPRPAFRPGKSCLHPNFSLQSPCISQ